jgi:hypothetical protein
MYLNIEVNHGFSGSMDFDIECYCSFNIQNRQGQTVWTLMLSRILGDIK